MTIPSATARNDYTGTGFVTGYLYTFKIFDDTDLRVIITNISGVPTEQLLNTDYTVSGVGALAGGIVILTTALPASYKLAILPRAVLTQQTSIRNQGGFFPDVIEDEFDRVVRDSQVLNIRADRAPHTSDSDSQNMLIPSAVTRANTVMGFDANGAIQLYTSLPNNPSASSVTATGSVTSRTLGARFAEFYNVKDYGALGDNVTDDSTAIGLAIAAAGATGTIFFPAGTFRMNITVSSRINIRGAGAQTTKLVSHAANSYAIVLADRNASWNFSHISDLSFGKDSNGDGRSGVRYGGTSYTTNDEFTGRWCFTNVNFTNYAGVFKQDGNIGNRFINCSFTCEKYCIYAYNRNITHVMHSGSDVHIGCHFTGATMAAYYVESSINGSGQTVFESCIFENNAGFGLYVRDYTGSWVPGLRLSDTWFETTATGGSAFIGTAGPTDAGTSYTPKNIYLRNVYQALFDNTQLATLELVASTAIFRHSGVGSALDSITKDSDSIVIVDDLNIDDSFNQGYYARSFTSSRRAAGGFASVVLVAARSRITNEVVGATLLQSEAFNLAKAYAFGGSFITVNSVPVSDGRLFTTCADITIPGASPVNTQTWAGVSITAGNWIVLTVDIKQVGANAPTQFQFVSGGTLAAPILTAADTWRTHAILAKNTGGAFTAGILVKGQLVNAVELRLSALQILSFSTLQAATEYLDGRAFCVAAATQRVASFTTAPTVGAWIVGDIVWNTAPAAGGTPGWVCTTAGTPGTWKAMANVAA